MAGEAWPIDASGGAPSYTAAEGRQLFSPQWVNVTADAFGVRAGKRPGAGGTVTFPTGTSYQVTPFAYVAYPRFSATQGPYQCQFGSNETGSMTAPHATLPRKDILYVIVDDNAVDGSGARQARLVYLAGTAASTPSAPAVPARGNLFGTISMPASGGGSPTFTPGPVAVASGGLLPVDSATDEAALTQHAGLQIVRTDLGSGVRKRSNGTAFIYESNIANTTGGAVMVAKTVSTSIVPASGSQCSVTLSGWAATPLVIGQYTGSFDWYASNSGSATTTQANFFVRSGGGGTLPDGTAVTLTVFALGIPTPGSTPSVG